MSVNKVLFREAPLLQTLYQKCQALDKEGVSDPLQKLSAVSRDTLYTQVYVAAGCPLVPNSRKWSQEHLCDDLERVQTAISVIAEKIFDALDVTERDQVQERITSLSTARRQPAHPPLRLLEALCQVSSLSAPQAPAQTAFRLFNELLPAWLYAHAKVFMRTTSPEAKDLILIPLGEFFNSSSSHTPPDCKEEDYTEDTIHLGMVLYHWIHLCYPNLPAVDRRAATIHVLNALKKATNADAPSDKLFEEASKKSAVDPASINNANPTHFTTSSSGKKRNRSHPSESTIDLTAPDAQPPQKKNHKCAEQMGLREVEEALGRWQKHLSGIPAVVAANKIRRFLEDSAATSLDLRGLGLPFLPNDLIGCPLVASKLQSLDCRDNRIRNLPEEGLAQCHQLRHLRASGNPLRSIGVMLLYRLMRLETLELDDFLHIPLQLELRPIASNEKK
jgi:hypothetical protein